MCIRDRLVTAVTSRKARDRFARTDDLKCTRSDPSRLCSTVDLIEAHSVVVTECASALFARSGSREGSLQVQVAPEDVRDAELTRTMIDVTHDSIGRAM